MIDNIKNDRRNNRYEFININILSKYYNQQTKNIKIYKF